MFRAVRADDRITHVALRGSKIAHGISLICPPTSPLRPIEKPDRYTRSPCDDTLGATALAPTEIGGLQI